MIEIALLPDHSILASMKALPTADHAAHRFVERKSEKRVQMIRQEHE